MIQRRTYLENRQGWQPQEDAPSYLKGARWEGRHPRSSRAPSWEISGRFILNFLGPPSINVLFSMQDAKKA